MPSCAATSVSIPFAAKRVSLAATQLEGVHIPLPTALFSNSDFLDFGCAIRFLIVHDISLQISHEHAAFLLLVELG
jgi:hypothetical protein